MLVMLYPDVLNYNYILIIDIGVCILFPQIF